MTVLPILCPSPPVSSGASRCSRAAPVMYALCDGVDAVRSQWRADARDPLRHVVVTLSTRCDGNNFVTIRLEALPGGGGGCTLLSWIARPPRRTAHSPRPPRR